MFGERTIYKIVFYSSSSFDVSLRIIMQVGLIRLNVDKLSVMNRNTCFSCPIQKV